MTADEEQSHRTVKSKRFLPKVMFLCPVARPRHVSHQNAYFNGKLGIWPFVETVKVQKNSVNRPTGTPELKPLKVKWELYKSFVIHNVFPNIRQKFRVTHSNNVVIQ